MQMGQGQLAGIGVADGHRPDAGVSAKLSRERISPSAAPRQKQLGNGSPCLQGAKGKAPEAQRS